MKLEGTPCGITRALLEPHQLKQANHIQELSILPGFVGKSRAAALVLVSIGSVVLVQPNCC